MIVSENSGQLSIEAVRREPSGACKRKRESPERTWPLTHLFSVKPQAPAHLATVACGLPLNENA